MEELSEIEIRRRALAAEASYMRQQLNKPAVSSINRPTISPLFTRENKTSIPKVTTTPFVTPTAKIASAPQITKQLSLPLSVAPKPTNAALGGAATIARGAMLARGAMTVGRMGSVLGWGSMLFPFLKGALKKGWNWLKRGTKGIGKRVPGAAMLLGGLSNMFGGRDAEGGEFAPEEGVGNALSGAAGGSETLGAALPTLKNPTLPALPTYKKGKGDKDSCCETTSRLLSIAIKYLAGIDATLKNQLDVERASFNQTNQAKREQSLEGGSGEKSGFGGSITKMVKSAGAGVLSFFSSMLMKTLLLTAPLIIKKISDMVDGFDFGDDENKDLAPQNGVTTISSGATDSGTAIKNVLKREGGYVNDPADKGGETKFGISKRSYPNLDIKNLTESQAAAIYKRDYWDKINADQLPANIREMAFDAAVNHGVSWTKDALSKSKNDPQKFLALRKEKYQRIVAEDPSQGKFLKGWMNRLGEFTGGGGGTMLASAPANVGALSTINAAALANVPSGSNATTPAPVVVAQNAPPPSSTTVTSGGPGDPSSVSSDRTLMTWIQYFSPMPA